MSRKRVERNIDYDDQKHLYYVTFSSPPNCDGPGKRRARTYRTYEAAAAALQQFQAGQAAGALPPAGAFCTRTVATVLVG